MTDAPLGETQEVIGGYALLETKRRKRRSNRAREFLKADGEGWESECEVRQLDPPR